MMQIFSRLCRLPLALVNGVAAAGGYLLFPAEPEMAALCAVLGGVLLLAAAGSALNQVLERDLDCLMARTRLRPLPNGDLTVGAATAVGGALLLAGLLLLGIYGSPLPSLLGAGALAWYLAIYTPLKRRTSFAPAIGAVCGALPPVIGWCFAGGNPTDYRVILIAGLMYLWQIPHFWLFQRRHADDYQRAGFPLFASPAQGEGVSVLFCRLWIFSLVAGTMLLPTFGIIDRHISLCLAPFFISLIFLSRARSEAALFSCLNLFPLLLPLALLAQK